MCSALELVILTIFFSPADPNTQITTCMAMFYMKGYMTRIITGLQSTLIWGQNQINTDQTALVLVISPRISGSSSPHAHLSSTEVGELHVASSWYTGGRLRMIRVGTGGTAHKTSQLSPLIRVRYFPIIDLAQLPVPWPHLAIRSRPQPTRQSHTRTGY